MDQTYGYYRCDADHLIQVGPQMAGHGSILTLERALIDAHPERDQFTAVDRDGQPLHGVSGAPVTVAATPPVATAPTFTPPPVVDANPATTATLDDSHDQETS